MHDAQRKLWERAAKHSYSNGLETGIPSFTAAKQVHKQLKKKGFISAAKALETVLVGAYRPDDMEGTIGSCRRCCKQVLFGKQHDFYECADNDNIEEKIFVKATRRIRGLVKNFEAWNVLWVRGMVPLNC